MWVGCVLRDKKRLERNCRRTLLTQLTNPFLGWTLLPQKSSSSHCILDEEISGDREFIQTTIFNLLDIFIYFLNPANKMVVYPKVSTQSAYEQAFVLIFLPVQCWWVDGWLVMGDSTSISYRQSPIDQSLERKVMIWKRMFVHSVFRFQIIYFSYLSTTIKKKNILQITN